MDEKRLNEIKARAEAATPGPWVDWLDNPCDESWARSWPQDAEFIGHARQDVPDLVAEVEWLTAALEEIAGMTYFALKGND
jgi:hypothetical protein